MYSTLLDLSQADAVSVILEETIEETGYTIEEAIPGLVQAIIRLASLTNHEEQFLDEAANLLADGGVQDDS